MEDLEMNDGTHRDLKIIILQNVDAKFAIYDAVSEKLLFTCNAVTAITSEGETTYPVTLPDGSGEIGNVISQNADQIF